MISCLEPLVISCHGNTGKEYCNGINRYTLAGPFVSEKKNLSYASFHITCLGTSYIQYLALLSKISIGSNSKLDLIYCQFPKQ